MCALSCDKNSTRLLLLWNGAFAIYTNTHYRNACSLLYKILGRMAACDSMCMIQDYLGQHIGSAGHPGILAHIF